ncbi:MAG: metal ABC transporter solute-binding protein, Zn/Mn family [Ktedonobacterales bacterium]
MNQDAQRLRGESAVAGHPHVWRVRQRGPRARTAAAALLALCVGVAALAGCATAGISGASGGKLEVVVGENFWGSIAAQLGGSHVDVASIVTDPNTDPHEYESNTNDARAFAAAQYVVLNGAGYDTWAQKLLDANPVDGRKVFTVADLLGKHQGDNPHFWYNPAYVERVADRITADYEALLPADATYFAQQRSAFQTALAPYLGRIVSIKATFAGQKVGATESIVVYLANALGLNLISPPAFMLAVSEGNDPPASSVALFQQQIAQRQITVLVYNTQTATDVTTTLKQLAAAHNIPVVGVSETMQPPGVTFQDWQYAQLLTLQNALSMGAQHS